MGEELFRRGKGKNTSSQLNFFVYLLGKRDVCRVNVGNCTNGAAKMNEHIVFYSRRWDFRFSLFRYILCAQYAQVGESVACDVRGEAQMRS